MSPPALTRAPVILDTDIGTNVDDALALAYLLRQPRCHLIGVTCTHPQPQMRAQLASAVCRALGQPEVPVHVGLDRPASATTAGRRVAQQAILEQWDHQSDFAGQTAVEFLRETIHAQPGQITLLTVGPLTNIAALFAADPQVPCLLKRLVIMGGVYLGAAPGYGFGEYNTTSDLAATTAVMNATVSETWCVGLDVSLRCRLNVDEVQRRLANPDMAILRELVEIWREQRKDVIFHDPLAAAVVFEPDLCTFATGTIRVQQPSTGSGCLMRFEESGMRHRVASGVDPGRFFRHHFEILTKAR